MGHLIARCQNGIKVCYKNSRLWLWYVTYSVTPIPIKSSMFKTHWGRVTHICVGTFHWRHNELDGVSDHQPRYCLLTCLSRHRLKKTSKLRVTGLCEGKMFPFDDVIMNLTIIGEDNGLSPGRRQAIIWTNTAILLIGPWGRNCNEILIGIHTFSFKKIHLEMSSVKWRPFCLGLNDLTHRDLVIPHLTLNEVPWHSLGGGYIWNISDVSDGII